MKKAAILSIATFYLLLTTGMFICIVHCAAELMVNKPAMQMAMQRHPSKPCTEKKDCDCCKKHDNFLVKENLKPGVDLQFLQTAILVKQFTPSAFLLNDPARVHQLWTNSNAPPGPSGKLISIQNCSLLI